MVFSWIGNLDHALLCRLGGLANRFADFVRLAEAEANAAVLVAGHDQRAEAEATSTLDDLGAAVDEDDFFRRFLRFGLVDPRSRICLVIFVELP